MLIGVLITNLTIAQKRVALNSNGATTIYSGSQPYIDAYNDAVDGDTIYLPGGQLSAPNSINKKLHIYGAGLRSDSSSVTEKTQVGFLTLQAGADGSHIEGIQFNGNVSFVGNTKIDSVVFRRNRVTGNFTIAGGNNDCQGIRIAENVIEGTTNLENTNQVEITNNILRFLRNVENGYIANNIMINTGNSTARMLMSVNQSLIENNYIANMYQAWRLIDNCSNNSFKNNVFNYDATSDASNSWENNFIPVQPIDIFVNYVWPFSESANFNLIDPASYQGTTGNEIGLYGGFYPAKQGFIPENPHYQFKNISSQTNTNGELEVEITIEAQNE